MRGFALAQPAKQCANMCPDQQPSIAAAAAAAWRQIANVSLLCNEMAGAN